ncbi:MAG: subtilase [Halobacteriovorax sp.]|nr:subtilase [Halobacteriovorax sp.]|tara:strand:- start:51442 stop:53127 length:1686 start_codon:yes stop_codon:yes gene_type:complete
MVSKFALAGGLLLGLSAQAFAAQHVPGELLVKFKDTKNLKSLSKSLGFDVKRTIDLSYGQIHVLKVEEKNLESMKATLNNNAAVEYAEPNFIYSIVKPVKEINMEDFLGLPNTGLTNETPNDPSFGSLWGLKNTGRNEPGRTSPGRAGADINALKAWKITKGSKDIKIAVIDTGIEYTHPDLRDNMWVNEAEANGTPGVDDDGNGYVDDIHGYDFANNDGDPADGHSHGTHCAGTIGAVHNNDEGVAGVMADVTLVAVKFLTDAGSGTTENAIKSVDYATKVGVDLMSNSWGGGGFSQGLADAIQRASDAGIIFTAAAGNSRTNNDERPHYPSNYEIDNVISVAAHTAQDELASFSCYGRTTVDIAAPGHRILSTVKNGGYKAYSGTSMATPHVSGILGLLLSKEGRMPHAEMRERLLATSVPVAAYRGKTVNAGRADVYNLLTDTRPERNEPKPGQWKTVRLSENWETAHPYADNAKEERTFKVDGAKFIRLKVAKYDLEKNYDYIQVAAKNRQVVTKVSGKGESYTTDFVEGDTIIATFKSDRSVNKWGFLIEEVEVQY